jgi:hypothetical protein
LLEQGCTRASNFLSGISGSFPNTRRLIGRSLSNASGLLGSLIAGPSSCVCHALPRFVVVMYIRESLERSKRRNVALLRQAIETLAERLAETEATDNPRTRRPEFGIVEEADGRSKIFVVHGHADGPRGGGSPIFGKARL